ncbi:regulatory LuxR family protein [Phycicoccus duodecadis]|uniref:Regulatory LuxR family protein n=1 Tax=Phycicoccus duodecadis TaxID=173053 RepID=A0A2N3YMW5_9MICO|nr:regulatory LuxR family protein [Phycicoccus duodecadis]
MSTARQGSRSVDAATFLHRVADLMLAGDDRFRLLGSSVDANELILRRASQVTTRVWSLHTETTLNGLRSGREAARLHPVPEHRHVFSPRAERLCPLLASLVPGARVGPAPGPMVITDDQHAFLTGPPGSWLAPTLWETTDPTLVACAREVFLLSWHAARPVTDVTTRPLLTARLLDVALALADGSSDREIAEELGIGARTTSAEVRRIIQWCGARSRGHAIAVLVGGSG